MSKGYQSYRGRRSGIAKLLAAVLTVVLLAAVAFLIYQRYATYTDDGEIHFNIPFLQGLFQKPEEAPPPEEGSDGEGEEHHMNLIIGEGDGAQPLEPPEPEPEPAPVTDTVRHLVMFETLPENGDALEEALRPYGANGFVYPIRNNEGKIFYASPMAANKAAVVDEAGTQALSALCAGDSLAVAQFNCFHDSYYAFTHMPEAAICQRNGYVWYDYLSNHWLDPSKEQARSYVTGLAVECAQLGFGELLLEEMCYPTHGKLEKIDYSGNTIGKTEALVLFLTELRTALEPYGTKISLLVGEELLRTGSNEESGEDLAALLPLVDAVYVQTGDISGAQALLAGYMGEGVDAPELVPLVQEPREGNWCVSAG